MKRINTTRLPDFAAPDTIYKLMPKSNLKIPNFYPERINRNIGIITFWEQNQIKDKVVAIAGCGGMGGYLGMLLNRLGVKEIRLADPEVFDVSNINRQFGANVYTIGKSKAMETARMIHSSLPDLTIEVYPMGIRKDMVERFVSGCDLVIDEIEIWEYEAPILLHQSSRNANIPIFSCNTAGFGTHLFLFTKDSMTLEEVLEVSLEEAQAIDEARRKKQMTEDELKKFVARLLLVVAPELEKNHPKEYPRIFERLVREQKASIISTNPAFATGFLANRIALSLAPSIMTPEDTKIPKMPGYAYMDARRVEGKIFQGRWW